LHFTPLLKSSTDLTVKDLLDHMSLSQNLMQEGWKGQFIHRRFIQPPGG
jgi:hypothetical protein